MRKADRRRRGRIRPREMPRARRRVWVLVVGGEGVWVVLAGREDEGVDAGAWVAGVVGDEEGAEVDELVEEETEGEAEAEAETRS